MSRMAMAVLAVLLAALLPAAAIDPRHHSDSASKQFSVFCEDVPLRMRVVSFAEEVKRDVLQLLGERDAWKAPIVIAIEAKSTSRPGEPPAQVRLIESVTGFKIQIDVRIGEDPSEVNLQKQIVRAVLLEYSYRGTGVQGGTAFREAPWWVIEGAIQLVQQREVGVRTDIFKRLIKVNKLPPLDDFLTEKPDELGDTMRAVDNLLAACLLQLLTSQPGGRAALAGLVREWPESNGDPVALLKRKFPELAADEATLQKWWTLGLARFAAADRFQGMTAEETEKELALLLSMEMPTGKGGEKQTFAVGDFAKYIKLPASRPLLAERHTLIVALSTRAHVLYRPVLVDYEKAFALLARGKTGGVRELLANVEDYRASVLRRISAIADYLNWYEATQLGGGHSHAFDAYLKTAREISEQEKHYSDAVTRYLDEMELEF